MSFSPSVPICTACFSPTTGRYGIRARCWRDADPSKSPTPLVLCESCYLKRRDWAGFLVFDFGP